MTDYREILRLDSLGISQRKIAQSCHCSRNTVAKILKRAAVLKLSWPLNASQTNAALQSKFESERSPRATKRLPDFDYVRKELNKNGVSKKLLWTEYMEECRLCGENPLMYSQFCHHIQLNEQKRRATMHISRKPGEQVEVDWAGDTASILDPHTGEITEAHIFVGVMTYSQYTYVEAFINEKQRAWITAHVHMYEYFGGVAKMLVPDNCKTAVIHNKGWYTQKLNTVYHEFAEHYNTAIIPARIRKPKDKASVEGAVGNISTWIVAALRKEQFFSLAELNASIRTKLEEFNSSLFQKKEGSRFSLFHDEELPLLAPLPATSYELAEWKVATVQFNYHISIGGMLYSVPFEYIKRKVDVRITDTVIEVFYQYNRIASHKRLYGRKAQYSTVIAHMPEDHQQYLEWNGNRFRKWAERIGPNTSTAVDAILSSKRVEQQTYKSCMGLLKLADRHSGDKVERACEKALSFTASPSYKSIKNILVSTKKSHENQVSDSPPSSQHAVTRGATYYGGKAND